MNKPAESRLAPPGGLAPSGALAPRLAPGLRARLGEGVVAAALVASYIGFEWVSSIHEYRGLPVTPWNPGLGVAFAVMVLKGPAFGLALFAGVVLAEILVLRTQLAWPVILAIAALLSASYTTAAALARGRLKLDVEIGQVRDVLILLIAGSIGAAASTVLLTLLLVAAGELDFSDLTRSALPLFVGDLIGIAVITPLVLRLVVRRPQLSLASVAPVLPEAALYLAVGVFALAMTVSGHSPGDVAFISLLFLPVVAAAIRHGVDGASLALAAAQLGLVSILHRHGYDAASFTAFQVVMFVLTTTGLLVGVVVSERREASRAARRAELELHEMQAQAARAARLNMLSVMASALAHEVNQPMTAARALARSVEELLRAGEPDLARVRDNIAGVVGQVDHAASVVRNIREFLRRGEVDARRLDPGEPIRDALALAQPEARARGILIELGIADGLPPIYGDRVQLQQVVLNLLRNAMESITETGIKDGRVRIAVGLDASREAVEIAVADNGPGVPDGLDVFEPLVSSRPDGLGLGLAICASIVTAHGGRIWLHSGAPGATEFRFSLPLHTGPQA